MLNKCRIENISTDIQNPKLKVFFLSPRDEAEKLYRSYINNEIRLSPQELANKIFLLKNLPISMEKSQNFKKSEEP